MRFLSIGECMAELAPTGTPGQYRLGFAGDTFNTVWYLRTLGPDIAAGYFSCVGTDAMSMQMLEVMTAVGIDISFVSRMPDKTVGLYMIALQNGERSFTYWRENSAARQLAADPDALARAMAQSDMIYFSGITLAILNDEGRATLLKAIGLARAAGKTVVFDPNLRPRLWPKTDAMTDATMQAAAVSDILLPSYDDEATHFGDADVAATADRYVGAGANSVIVKNGGGPIHFWHDGQRGEIAVPPVSVIVDTTSAGDSFNAALLAALHRGTPVQNAIRTASQVAAQVIGGPGALVQIDMSKIDI